MKENSVLFFSYVRSTGNHPLKDSRILAELEHDTSLPIMDCYDKS